MDTQARILDGTEQLFFRFGIKGITMDDIARNLGISKKTIYQFFEDKNALVQSLIGTHLQRNEKRMCALPEQSENAIHEIILTMEHMVEMFKRTNPAMFHDLMKYHPAAYATFQDFRRKKLYDIISKNLERGIKEKLYRPDIHIPTLAILRLEEVQMSFDPSIFEGVARALHEVHHELIKHFLFGISTVKGHKLVNEYLNINENDL
jgi:AcrR family transcriptional regulator